MKKFDQQLDKANQFFREKRDILFSPITKLLYKLRISANTLSISKLIFVCLYLLLIKNHFNLAIFFLLFGGILLDFLDGPLARYAHQDSDRGKFIDMISDQLVYVLFIWGLMLIKIGNPLILSFNIIIISAFYFMIVINKNENKKSDWIIKPIARANYYKLTLEISIVLHIFFKMNELFFNNIILIINILVTIHFMYHLIKFSKKEYLKMN
jgi:phosphatidylglycerophosphate synthase